LDLRPKILSTILKKVPNAKNYNNAKDAIEKNLQEKKRPKICNQLEDGQELKNS